MQKTRVPIGVAFAALAMIIAGFTAAAQSPPFKPLTDEVLRNPAPDDWPMWRRTYNSWGYSPLDRINAKNVGTLQLAWSFAMGPGNRSEPTPTVANGIMFLSSPNDLTHALNAATGELLWEYRRKVPAGETSILRNLAVYEDAVIIATADAHIVALDARTGKVRWDTEVADYRKGYGYTSGPIVAKGKVITGIAGCSGYHGENCFITAHDARTGKELWRTFTIARPGEPGGDTWGNLPMSMRNGGEVWIPCSYDPDLDLVYCGVAQAKPWAASSRGLTVKDAALYTLSTLALNPDTGKIVWYHQYVPGETLDMDENYEHVLIDRGGTKALLQFGKHGVLWKLNRETGQYLAHKALVFQNIFEYIDPRTGAVTYNPATIPQIGKEVFQCPSHGNTSWITTTYSPAEGLLYAPISRNCITFTALEVERVPGKGGSGGARAVRPMPNVKDIGELAAVDVDTLNVKWSYQQRAPFTSGLLATGGGLLFAGDLNRYFRAFDAKTGTILWETRLPTAVGGFATTYSVNGEQYVAVPTGHSNIGALLAGLVPEIRIPPPGNGVYVFKLPARR